MRAWHGVALGAAAVAAAALWWWPETPAPAAGPPTASAPARAERPPEAPPPALVVAPSRSAAPALAASVPAPRRPLPAWTQLTLDTPLADVLAAAQASGNAAELLAAVRLVGTCGAARHRSEAQLAAINEMRLSAMAPVHAASAAARQAGQQHRSLLRYCAVLDDPAIGALADAVWQRLAGTANTWQPLAGQPRKPRGEGWPQQQYQSALLSLTDPAAHAATLDTVLGLLTPPVPPGREGLNTWQADVVRVLVAQELTGDRNPLSVANTAACVQRAVCDAGSPAFAADPANRLALAAAQHWLQLIRTQQWAAIGLLPK